MLTLLLQLGTQLRKHGARRANMQLELQVRGMELR